MKILILHSHLWKIPREDQLDTLNEVEAVKKSLINLWHKVSGLDFEINLEKNIENISKIEPNFVFNLVEDILWKWKLIHLATWILEYLKIPYSGCDDQSMFVTTNKILSKKIMKWYKIPTADRFDLSDIESKKLKKSSKYIIKAIDEDASVWIDKTCVISGHEKDKIKKKLVQKEKEIWSKFFAEEFIDGREFNISIMTIQEKPIVLPHAEIVFSNFKNKNKIIDYNAKRNENSFEYKNTNRSFELEKKDKKLLDKLIKVTMKCRKVFELSWYARVDFRVDNKNNIYVLEINANPCISPDAWFFAACQKYGMTYDEMIKNIVAF